MPAVIHNPVVMPFGPVDFARERRSALTLADAVQVLPGVPASTRRQSPVETAYELCEILRTQCELRGSHDHLFLLLYFDHVIRQLYSGAGLHNVLVPLPNAQFPTAEGSITADFAFWTGQRFVIVFIRESSFDPDWSKQERLLKSWGFEVFQLMAEQIETRGLSDENGAKVLEALRIQ